LIRGRSDLNLGFWDLTRDDQRLQTLLKREGITREVIEPAPSTPSPVPLEIKQRVSEVTSRKANEKESRRLLHERIFPRLNAAGWVAAHWKTEGSSYILPLGRQIPALFAHIGTTYTLFGSLVVYKKQLAFILSVPAHSGAHLVTEFLERNEKTLRAIPGTAVDAPESVIARFEGLGWEFDDAKIDAALTCVDGVLSYLRPQFPELVQDVERHMKETNFMWISGLKL
jgi:hypothetical protein